MNKLKVGDLIHQKAFDFNIIYQITKIYDGGKTCDVYRFDTKRIVEHISVRFLEDSLVIEKL